MAVLLTLGAQLLTARHLPIQVYTGAQGLPRNTVGCMLPTPDGLLWLCTMQGLARFDGYHFHVFGPEQGLPSRNILAFTEARKGGYWLLTDQGLCRLAPESKIGDRCRLLDDDIKAAPFYSGLILESQGGETWVSNSHSLFRVSADGRRLERTTLRVPPNYIITALADGLDGGLLVGTDYWLYQWRPGEPGRGLSESFGQVGIICFYRRSADEYWIGTTKGFFRLRREADRQVFHREALPGMPPQGYLWINSIVQRRDKTIWLAGNGAMRLEAGGDGHIKVAARYTEADGLPSAAVTGLVEDAQGNLWGATEGSGIFRIEEAGFISYSGKDGLGTARIASLLEDPGGRLLVQTSWDHSPDIMVKDGDRFRAIPIRLPISVTEFGWGWNQYLVEARDGSWWIPSGNGMLRFPKLGRTEDLSRSIPEFLDEHSALGCKEIFRGWEDPSGDVWITCLKPTDASVRWQRKTGKFQHFTEADGLPADAGLLVFRAGPPGTLWMASSNLAVRFRNERFETFPLAPEKRAPYVRDLLVDSAGRVWLATQHGGLFRCDNANDAVPVFRAYTVAEGLSADFVSSVVEDEAGYIYAGTARGVDRIDPRAPIGSRHIRHFTTADGLPDSEENTALRDREGHLWFGTLAGLAELDPAKSERRPAPDIYLTRVRVRGEDVPLPWRGTRALALQLAADRNQVEIEYSAIDLSSPESLLFQYQLHGADHGWSEPVERLDVNYASLPAGDFRFEVRAVDADGQVSQQTAGFDFSIAVPLWRRWWALTGMTVLLTAGLVLLYDYRVRQLLAMERLRTRIATDLHDDIGASLTQISILSELARRGSAPQVLADIANIARAMVSDMSDIVWAVNPRHDRFDGLVHRMRRFSNDVLGGADIDLQFHAEGLPGDVAVPLDSRRPLYLVLKEAVNNVARHSGAKNASIQLELQGGDLKLTVNDDGRGFDATAAHAGEGLASIARRMRDVGGTATWEAQAGGGTRFTAVLPLPGRTVLHELIGKSNRIRR